MLTLNARSEKCDLNHVIVLAEKPIACNLPRRTSWFILSKAFWKSISIIPEKSTLWKNF